eukprot:UN00550
MENPEEHFIDMNTFNEICSAIGVACPFSEHFDIQEQDEDFIENKEFVSDDKKERRELLYKKYRVEEWLQKTCLEYRANIQGVLATYIEEEIDWVSDIKISNLIARFLIPEIAVCVEQFTYQIIECEKLLENKNLKVEYQPRLIADVKKNENCICLAFSNGDLKTNR